MVSALSPGRLRARKAMTGTGENGKPRRSRKPWIEDKGTDLKPCRKRDGFEHVIPKQEVKQLKVRLIFEEAPPNPRDQDDVEWYECIQDIARRYNDLKKQEDTDKSEVIDA